MSLIDFRTIHQPLTDAMDADINATLADVPPIKKTRASRPLFHPPGARYCNYIANNVALH